MNNYFFDPAKCQTMIYKKDQLRRTGRGKYGFEMHYTEQQCSRKPKYNGFCFQHKPYVPKVLTKPKK